MCFYQVRKVIFFSNGFSFIVYNERISGGSKFGKTVEELKISVPESCEISEGKLLNGRQSISSIKMWVDTLSI